MEQKEQKRRLRDGAALHVTMQPNGQGTFEMRVDYEGTDTAICYILADVIQKIASERATRPENIIGGAVAMLEGPLQGGDVNLNYARALAEIRKAHAKARKEQRESTEEAGA